MPNSASARVKDPENRADWGGSGRLDSVDAAGERMSLSGAVLEWLYADAIVLTPLDSPLRSSPTIMTEE